MTADNQDRDLDQVLARLREEIVGGTDGPPAQHVDDRELSAYSAALAEIPDDFFDARALEAVDRLLERGEGVAPEQRERLVGAARRALEQRCKSDQPLQPLLAAKRSDSGIEATQAATWLGLEPKTFLSIESGETPLSKVRAEDTAEWIRRLGVDEDIALRAVRRSLQLVGSASRFGRRPRSEMTPAQIEEYVGSVRRALGATR